MKNLTDLTRPVIVVESEKKYVQSFGQLRDYFIKKFPNFFKEINKNKTGDFKMELSSKVYDNHLARVAAHIGYGKSNELNDTVMRYVFERRDTEEFDVKISLLISTNPSIGITFINKRNWGKNQADISFFDHSQENILLLGEKRYTYDSSVLSPRSESYFIEIIGFASERTTTIKDALDTIEQVFKRIEYAYS